MRKYDLLAISLLMFSVILVTDMAVGPIGLSLSALQAWQPLMAAIIALDAGALAYRGAMAKVTADADRDRRELNRKKIGLYLRLLYPMEKMNVRAEDVRKLLSGSRTAARKFPPSVIRIVIPDEVEEAWKNLELFPVQVAVALDNIRTELPNAKRLLNTFPDETVIEISHMGISYGHALRPYLETCEKVEAATAKLITSLGQELVRIRSLESA
jgi:hypothetical protein